MQIPGDNFTALLKAKIIEDPFYRSNEKDVQWIGQDDWTFSQTFSIDNKILEHDQLYLTIKSLDTFAEIYINNKLVDKSKNMFTRIQKDIKSFLKIGKNEIKIKTFSLLKEIKKEISKLPFPIPCASNVNIAGMNLVRKTHCHGGWDWGISMPVSGIYEDIYIESTNQAIIQNLYTEQKHSNKNCEVKIFLEIFADQNTQKEISIHFADQEIKQKISLNKGLQTISFKVQVKNPKLWWPNGYGEQPLYPLSCRLDQQNIHKKIGLRKLNVINQKDKIGKSLIFQINDIDIFCKGANWIPTDAFPTRQTKEVYENLLLSAKSANMNMIRVWGGGQYEKDEFYELCDELGLMVWQDLMFACSLYPSTPEFIKNVEEELDFQVKRLRDHSCITLWCGDNEVIGALTWYKESKENRDTYLVNYDRLNQSCEKAVLKNDSTRIFWPSSPCAGPNDFSNTFHDDSCGDMHYWRVWHGGLPLEAYYDVKPRFCSEFGFQSFASFELTKTFTKPEDWNVTSPIMEAHQKNKKGNSIIANMFSLYFRLPQGFENFIYLSQVQQAFAIKMGVEYWRQIKPTCMGTLFWQLNDNWPVASWSSIEYGGRWKQLHYHAKRFFATTIATITQKEDTLEIWSVNDAVKAEKAKLTTAMYDFNGKLIKKVVANLLIPQLKSKFVKKYSVKELTKDQPENYFLTTTLESSNGSFPTHENTHFFTQFKKCELQDAPIKVKISKEKGQVKIQLEANKPLFFVHLEIEKSSDELSDSSFTLLPKKTKTIYLTSKSKLTEGDIKKRLKIRHLRQTY